ncbi:MAG TPA: tRNA 4-thiouridine(8) synthase ThiI [Spirochaetota bacterium]|nr:tRNA 4-thiouridine(8) synthase ThiI [Spirochaetota bacterium]HOL56550.1 tRNA 4-thiouridine(8) synthase ThiI [Spirochaetota bacterium]HPP03987.1 tRNA 4-thiouridine(8) synthase ThiI [Spirochaetota bacterium]
MNKKAIAMISGGLDSLLSVKIMQKQGIDLIGLHFILTFTNSSIKKEKDGYVELKYNEKLGIDVINIFNDLEYFKVIQKPKFGYGQGINPCIDCKIYMFKRAKELMKEYNASFIVSGEVVGQRPMSQLKRQIEKIEKEAGLEGLILRPLSALVLPETIPEKEGIIDRSKLFGISGRTRREQMELAKQFGITDYPTPGGGCMLTDKIFSKRVRDLFDNKKEYSLTDLHLLKLGRHFRFDETKIIVGRNKNENIELENLAIESNYPVFIPSDIPGPSIVVDGMVNDNIMRFISYLMFRYSDAKDRNEIIVRIRNLATVKDIIIKRNNPDITIENHII